MQASAALVYSLRGEARLQAATPHQHPASPQLLKHFEQPQLTSVRSVVNECGDEKDDTGISGCEHAPEQAGTPSSKYAKFPSKFLSSRACSRD